MRENTRTIFRLPRLITDSPWFPLLFVAVFALFLLSQFVRLPRFLLLDYRLLIVNNICFLLIIAFRFARCLTRFKQPLRYDTGHGGRSPVSLQLPPEQARETLSKAGFSFTEDGGYGEKSSRAFLWTTLLYGCLLFALLLGTYDFGRQFSGTILTGAGNPMPLNTAKAYYMLSKGFLASPAGLPSLKVKEQFLPSERWPRGASAIVLIDDTGREVAAKTIAWDGEPLRYKGFEYHMGRFILDATMSIKTSSGKQEFYDKFNMQPRWGFEGAQETYGPYTYFAKFKGFRGNWKALYDPNRKAFRMIMTKDGVKLVDDEVIFQKDREKNMGDFVVEPLGMGVWSEIHVVRPRHVKFVIAGAVLAVLAGLVRLFVRPQRVWLEESEEGCRVRIVGGEAKMLMRDEKRPDER